jgi:hypothetical protein
VDDAVLVDGLHPDLDRRIEPILGRGASAARRAAPDLVIAAIREVVGG